jgi:hydroxymethylglutaryl-CoA reductase
MKNSLHESLGVLLHELALDEAHHSMHITLMPSIPRAMGLGASAAMAVAVIRALDEAFRLGLDDEAVNRLALEAEKVAHGTPSGLDNTVATYGELMLFRRGTPPTMRPLPVRQPIPVVVGVSGKEGLTAATVGRVRDAWKRDPKLHQAIFDQIDRLTMQGVEAIEVADWERLGELMNINHGLLNALQVSCQELEELVQIARNAGALGAKLTGGGGGGSIIALCPGRQDEVAAAMRRRGYHAIVADLGNAQPQRAPVPQRVEAAT